MALAPALSGRGAIPGVVAALLLLAAPASADPLADAAQSYADGNIAQARADWLRLAAQGDAQAAYRLGLLSDIGQGTAENPAEAYRWYRRAAEGGNAAAQFNVAVMEDNGRGTAHDVADAQIWYARSAARGNSRAQYDMGLLYESGDGVPQNPAAARAWFKLALAGGLHAASAKLEAPGGGEIPPGGPKGDTLQSAIPVAPRTGTVVARTADNATEIVWSAPREPVPVRYFLQVVERTDDGLREMHAEYADATAALIHLDPGAHICFWRVFTVSSGRARYVVSPWTAFSLQDLA